MKRILQGRVLIKKIEASTKSKGGLTIPLDADSLPQAEIVMIATEVENEGLVAIGDKVYYQEARERGRCKHNGEDHFIIPIANVIAII